MASITEVRYIDDLDGSDAVGTVAFSLERRAYEIDLSDENTDALHEALAPFIEKARRAGTPTSSTRQLRSVRTAGRKETAEIRRWALDRGYQISGRGRIPGPIRQAYDAEHGEQASA